MEKPKKFNMNEVRCCQCGKKFFEFFKICMEKSIDFQKNYVKIEVKCSRCGKKNLFHL